MNKQPIRVSETTSVQNDWKQPFRVLALSLNWLQHIYLIIYLSFNRLCVALSGSRSSRGVTFGSEFTMTRTGCVVRDILRDRDVAASRANAARLVYPAAGDDYSGWQDRAAQAEAVQDGLVPERNIPLGTPWA